MGFGSVTSACVNGLQVEFIQVEADVSVGLPVFHMVGYLSSEVKEASERVRTAIHNLGVTLPARRTVVNLSPAIVRKKGNLFDLPVAVAVLYAQQMIPAGPLEKTLFVGELSLSGEVLPVEGILIIAIEAMKKGIRRIVLSAENRKEAELVGGIEVIPVRTLSEVCAWTKGQKIETQKEENGGDFAQEANGYEIDYRDIKGQECVKRATMIAVAGNHNILYWGPPGSGKTMLAKRIVTILPELSWEESLEITRIYSAAGKIKRKSPLVTTRPFREVHHTVTRSALLGGGRIPSPGEVTLAHKGILFLDELAEFQRNVIEGLREPMEDKTVSIIRQYGAYHFPAEFMLVAAMNPCPCGNFPDISKCTCSEYQIKQYLGKISQPFLDRIDVCIEAPKVRYEHLVGERKTSSSEEMREQVKRVREIQTRRFAGEKIQYNAQMTEGEIKKYCKLDLAGDRVLRKAYDRLGLTARTYHKVLKVARTIADLENEENIKTDHLKEALSYRMMEVKKWGET